MLYFDCPHLKKFIFESNIIDINFFKRLAYNNEKDRLPLTFRKHKFFINIDFYHLHDIYNIDIYHYVLQDFPDKHKDEEDERWRLSDDFVSFAFELIEQKNCKILKEKIDDSFFMQEETKIPLSWLIENEEFDTFNINENMLKLAQFNFS